MSLRLGVVRDKRFLDHKTGPYHPESPKRLMAVYDLLDRRFPQGLISITPEVATLEQLEMVHTPAYIKRLMATAQRPFTNLAMDTVASAKSYFVAALAAGGCIKGLEALMTGRCQACFALVRPPGHHALPHQPQGFCLFNNLGIAVRAAQRTYALERILIVDWDYHHGNGLEQLFYKEKEVLYFSTHYLGSYPSTGDWEEVGLEAGQGYTINLPLPKEVEDPDLAHIYREVLGPVISGFDPQLVMVAAGFDSHRDDPLGVTRLSEKAFGALARLVRRFCLDERGIPVLLALEGGYDPLALAGCVQQVIQALVQDEDSWQDLTQAHTPRGQELVNQARQVHAGFGV
ncbi:MAG: histone deacetylase, partial [Desulfarculaceae bacterium]